MTKIKVFRPDGTSEERELARDPSLEDLQQIVGGYIELIPMQFKLHGEPSIMYVNEDGRSRKLSPNLSATKLTGGIHAIVGTAVVVQLRGGPVK